MTCLTQLQQLQHKICSCVVLCLFLANTATTATTATNHSVGILLKNNIKKKEEKKKKRNSKIIAVVAVDTAFSLFAPKITTINAATKSISSCCSCQEPLP